MSAPLRPTLNFVSDNKFHVLEIYDKKIHDPSTTKLVLEKEIIPTKLLDKAAKLPTKGSARAAGHDLYAAEDATIPAGQRGLVDTKIAVALPPGTYGRIVPRSGLAVKKGIDIGVGVIDADYRGALKVLLINSSDRELQVKQGDRVAQLIIERIADADLTEVDDLTDTNRSGKGFGSTGILSMEMLGMDRRRKLEVEIQLRDVGSGRAAKAKVLIDSGATGMFVDETWARKQGWELEEATTRVPVYNVDGMTNKGGRIKHTVELLIRYEEHQERAVFMVMHLGGTDVILGHPWLKRHNPRIDWAKETIRLTRCPPACQQRRKVPPPMMEEEREEEGRLGSDKVKVGERIFALDLESLTRA